MSYTKLQIINDAFGEIGLSDFVFDLTPGEQQQALRQMDRMMAEWSSRGIRVGYPLPSSPGDSNLSDDSTLPDVAVDAVLTNLAIRLASSLGRQVSADLRIRAKSGYDLLLREAAKPIPMQFPDTLPVGAGNRRISGRDNFMPSPTDPLETGPDGLLEF